MSWLESSRFDVLRRQNLSVGRSSAMWKSILVARLLMAIPRSTAQCVFDQWPPRSMRSHQDAGCLASEALKNLEQFIQLKGVADGVHDSVL